jgi:hypothetical protein
VSEFHKRPARGRSTQSRLWGDAWKIDEEGSGDVEQGDADVFRCDFELGIDGS